MSFADFLIERLVNLHYWPPCQRLKILAQLLVSQNIFKKIKVSLVLDSSFWRLLL